MEKYLEIFKAPSQNERPFIKKDCEICFDAKLDSVKNKKYRLFFAGETATSFTWKTESDCRIAYFKIDDALSSKDSRRAQYCVKLEGCDYPKIIYKKIIGASDSACLPNKYFEQAKFKPVVSYLPLGGFTETWKMGVWAKAEGVALKENAKLKMTVEIRENMPGVSRHDITVPASFVYEINFEEGSYDWKEISKEIFIPESTCSVCVFIEAENFEGNLYLESPQLVSSNGFNILPEFEKSSFSADYYTWVCQNLSKSEWPEFEITVNDKPCFRGAIFERCHVNSECEVSIPDSLLCDGENKIKIKLVTDMDHAPAYQFNEVALIEEPCHDFDVVSLPDFAPAGKPFSVLLDINEPTELCLESDIVSVYANDSLKFEKTGLAAIRLISDRIVNDLTFTLKSKSHTENCYIKRILEKPIDDGVVVGTGDMVYVQQKKESFEDYLRFHFSEGLGNLVTLRPVYRWCGSRKYDPEAISSFVKLLNHMGVKYSNMTDGREPNGFICNPPIGEMQKTYDGIESGFVGRQKHEQDGAYNYWFFNDFSNCYERELGYDLTVRNFMNNPDTTSHFEHAPGEQFFDGDNLSIFKHRNLPDDMEGMKTHVVTQLRDNKYNNTRHTGPSVMFKYFYEAGYDWTGAELLYGPHEVIIAAMRGAYRGYEKENGYGAHLALQWSTHPHNVVQKYRRYMLGLYLSYMHGVNEINLEEGLYHIEEYYTYHNRFDDCCKAYIKEQREFYKYLQSHTRSGDFYAPFAFIHGRDDGTSLFSKAKVWGRDSWNYCDAEASWDILSLFYPKSELDNIYRHFCPTDEPIGMFTGTPRGNTDIIPMETRKFSRYKAISFMGYNHADKCDFDALLEYINDGGTVILGWPHLATTTNREDIEKGNFSYLNHKLVDLVAGHHSIFASDMYKGKPVTVCNEIRADEVIATTDRGIPLLVLKHYGKGQIFFINAEQYPSNEAVRPLYDAIITEISDNINAEEKIFVSCGDDVGFTIFDQQDGSRHIYLIPVDWYKDADFNRKAELKISGKKFELELPFGKMLKVVAKDELAVYSDSYDVEVLLISSDIVTIQGYGKQCVNFIYKGEKFSREIDFTGKPIQAIKL